MYMFYIFNCFPSWGEFPFEMHSAADELDNLSYGTPTDTRFADVGWWGT